MVKWPNLSRSKKSQNNSHTNFCLPTLINSHPCLTWSKKSQNNYNTNSCLPTLILAWWKIKRKFALSTILLLALPKHSNGTWISFFSLAHVDCDPFTIFAEVFTCGLYERCNSNANILNDFLPLQRNSTAGIFHTALEEFWITKGKESNNTGEFYVWL